MLKNIGCQKFYRFNQLNFLPENQGGSPGLAVMGGDSRQKVVGSNPSTRYWMDIFSHLFVVKMQRVFETTIINEKEAGVGPFLKNILPEKNCIFRNQTSLIFSDFLQAHSTQKLCHHFSQCLGLLGLLKSTLYQKQCPTIIQIAVSSFSLYLRSYSKIFFLVLVSFCRRRRCWVKNILVILKQNFREENFSTDGTPARVDIGIKLYSPWNFL